MLRRIITIALSLCMVLCLFSGCQSDTAKSGSEAANSQSNDSTENTDASEEYEAVTLVMAYPIFVSEPQDQQLVVDEINKITQEKYNITVETIALSTSAYGEQIRLGLIAQEQIDLLVTGNMVIFDLYTNQVNNGQLYPISDLFDEYGQDIVSALDEKYLYASEIDGKVYGVPQNRDLATGRCLIMDKEIVDKYDIDVEKEWTTDDFTELFAFIKENEPDLYPFFPGETPSATASAIFQVDDLDDQLGVLLNWGLDNTDVVNKFEADQYVEAVKLAKEWYDAGYMYPDGATTDQTPYELLAADRVFSFFSSYKPGMEGQSSRRAGKELVAVQYGETFTYSAKVTNFMWSISAHTANPEQAMRLLNLTYGDTDIQNLLAWGIEGVHYEKVEGTENTITYPEGVDSDSTGYNLGSSWMFGNEMLSYVWEGDDDDLREQMDTFNKEASPSNALGFIFHNDEYSTEVAALTNIIDEYQRTLECGIVSDVDATLKEFNDKLYAAGLQKVIDAKQAQLDEYLAGKE